MASGAFRAANIGVRLRLKRHKKNEGDYGWNGHYGAQAKCYTATGVCAKRTVSAPENCNSVECIANLGRGKECINKEVNADGLKACIAKYEARYPGLDIDNSSFTGCSGAESYFVFNGRYYQEKAEKATLANGKLACKNKLLTDGSAGETKAKAWVQKHLHDTMASKIQACIDAGIFGRVGSSNYEIRIPQTYEGAYPSPTPMSKGYETCVLLKPGLTGNRAEPCFCTLTIR